ncbi:LPS assembly lipoprotein LptE [Helicobacter sp. 10-6591]|uniref:LPS assembly lipoprotein LptE n=1 Tax=Helicobacter sp. 10-6591 TaxID=2004998 RepID=UPI0011BD8BD0|nr:LPS assembly lipoprotein LptE [Helicobacter sp. 10-6591]MCI7484708.1 LPS assembly lipoprotein LptE [Helicobacter sp.]
MNLCRLLTLSALVFLLGACGYLPMSRYSEFVFGEGVYVELTMNPLIPEASVGAKDTINLAILTRFHNTLASKENANTIIDMRVNSVTNSPIAYDSNGFVSFYRVSVDLNFVLKNKDGVRLSVSNSGYYDYAANSTSAVIIEDAKLNAISNATTQALDKFISQVAFHGSQIEKNAEQSSFKEDSKKTAQE